MNANGKYLKDESGIIFSPIASTNTVYDANNTSLTNRMGDIEDILDSINGTSVVGSYQEKTLTISENGTTVITPDTTYDAMSKVTVNVDAAGELQTKTVSITSNTTTTISPDSGYDGMSKVTVTTSVAPATPSVSRYGSNFSGNTTYTVFTYNPGNTATRFQLTLSHHIGNTGAISSSTISVYVQGSQDNSSWTTIQSFSNKRGTTTTISYNKTYTLTGYKYYRIRMSSTDNETFVSLHHFRINY